MIEELGIMGKRIFEADLSDDKTVLTLTEACDGYHSVELTKDQVIEIANDFLKIAETMK